MQTCFFSLSLEASSDYLLLPPRVDFHHLAFIASATNVSRFFALILFLALFSVAYFLVGVIYLMSSSIKRDILSVSSEVSFDLEATNPAKRFAKSAPMSFAQAVSTPPSSIPPVIISPQGEHASIFLQFDFKLKNQFLKGLEAEFGKVVSAHVKAGGDYFIFPHNQKQKDLLLKVTQIGELPVICSKTKSETESRGTIFNVPENEDLDYIQELLLSQKVINVRRRHRKDATGSLIPTRTLNLTFFHFFEPKF